LFTRLHALLHTGLSKTVLPRAVDVDVVIVVYHIELTSKIRTRKVCPLLVIRNTAKKLLKMCQQPSHVRQRKGWLIS